MIPILEATSAASSSGPSLMKAFLSPSGRIKVFTLIGFLPYKSLNAFLMVGLEALRLTTKTRVFCSSIHLIAVSVLRGYLMVEYLSLVMCLILDLFKILAFLGRASGFLRWKVAVLQTFLFF